MRTSKKFRAITGGKNIVVESGAESNKYQVLFDQASDAIITVLEDGKIDAANQAIEEMTGFLKDELVGSPISILVPEASAVVSQHRVRALASEHFKIPGTYEDIAIQRKDGYIRFVDVNVRVLSNGKSKFSLALLRDLTEKKRMERELITKHTELRQAYVELEKKNVELQSMQETLVQTGKMAALGELAAGIAHELNQPLQGIRGYAQEIQAVCEPALKDKKEKPEVELGLKEIISNAEKMASIIDHLRIFIRRSTEKHEFVDVHHAIEEALKMLSRQFASRGIKVERDFGKIPTVYANPVQMEQVFINLATNARDAIEATDRGHGTVKITSKVSGNFVEVSFRDDGVGMTEKTKAKIFNPFFTTKEVGKGMGLGLSLSYGILSKIHGSMVVESKLGKGTEFLVRIPRDFRETA